MPPLLLLSLDDNKNNNQIKWENARSKGLKKVGEGRVGKNVWQNAHLMSLM
jgi:hypothetical protein